MTAVVLIAVMVDRRAITFRTLAVAALIVLSIAPEALVHPSFQMSFAATLGLVALVQIGMPRLFAAPDHSATARVALWGGREITMLVLASLVAGLATTPYAAFHFHRVTPYGVLANLAAMPVVSALVMPAGLLGLVAMPFGFDGVFWAIMGVGIDWMIVVTQWVAALARRGRPHGGVRHRAADRGQHRHHPAWPVANAVALVRRGRAAGCGGLGGAGAAAGHSDLRRRPQRRRPRPRRTAASDARGQGWFPGQGMAGGGCRSADGDGCLARRGRLLRRERLRDAQPPAAAFVALALRPEALADDCERAALVVTARPAPAVCAASVIDAERLRRQGALALRRSRDGFAVDAVKPKGIDRPWSPAIAGDGEAETTILAPRVATPRAVDATPSEADLQAEE